MAEAPRITDEPEATIGSMTDLVTVEVEKGSDKEIR